MHYQVSRNGQEYGPYTLEDLQRYLASGNILATDLAKSEEMTEWLPVSQILGPAVTAIPSFSTPSFSSQGFANPGTDPVYGQPAATLAASPYQDAPNLHWGLVLLFAFLTCGLFMIVWNLIICAWLKRVQPNATALFFYFGAVGLLVVNFGIGAAAMGQVMAHRGNPAGPFLAIRLLIGLSIWVLRLIARYSERASLEEHFNGPEPVGLQLNPVMTFFFGGLYFQSKLNEINTMKQAARLGAGRTY